MSSSTSNVLILTPVKSALAHIDSYFAGLERLGYPRDHLSLGLLEGDSTDGSYDALAARMPEMERTFRRAVLLKKDFGFRMPPGIPRHSAVYQAQRRGILARARNHLLFGALGDEDWVLWLDVDVIAYPDDVIEHLLGVGRSIVHPHCVHEYGGPTFDLNAWTDGGRTHMDALRGGLDLIRLESVGGTMLLVSADCHRDGLVFPPYFYGARSRWIRDPHPLQGRALGEIETEGLAIMAKDMGVECWGMPNLEILHAKA